MVLPVAGTVEMRRYVRHSSHLAGGVECVINLLHFNIDKDQSSPAKTRDNQSRELLPGTNTRELFPRQFTY